MDWLLYITKHTISILKDKVKYSIVPREQASAVPAMPPPTITMSYTLSSLLLMAVAKPRVDNVRCHVGRESGVVRSSNEERRGDRLAAIVV